MKFPCTLKNALLIIRDRFGLSFASKGLGYLAALFFTNIVTCSLQIILLSNYSATYNFSTYTHYLTENYLSFPSAPRWVQHSYLSKGIRLIPYTCGPSQDLSKRLRHNLFVRLSLGLLGWLDDVLRVAPNFLSGLIYLVCIPSACT